MAIQVIILAAGMGKRMLSSRPKVLQTLGGKTLLEHVIAAANAVSPKLSPIVVCGHQAEQLRQQLKNLNVRWVEQKEQSGTGHAVQQAMPQVNEADQVLVLYGDVPLISMQTLKQLIDATPHDTVGMLTANVAAPFGYGRIKRDAKQHVTGIVEEKDATADERAITEINSGIYLLPASLLKQYLPALKPDNAQGEYYLTDIIKHAVKDKHTVHVVQPHMQEEILGVNDFVQLAQLERIYQRMMAEKFMRQGVKIIDPARFDVRGEVQIGRDVCIDVNVILEGDVVIGDGCSIGANTILRNTTLGEEVTIKPNSMLDGASVGAHASIGPFARLRPDSTLAAHVHIGNFVEIKNSAINEKTKINHLSYVGDSEIGKEVNIGAGTITCNYDGFAKHKTVIGDRVQVGSDTTLVAPVTIHADAYIATATTVRKDVPAGALAFNTREERIKEGWVATKREKHKDSTT